MERIRIPNAATYLPIAPADLLFAAPLAARVLFGATLPGRVLQAAAVGIYAGSAAIDWALRADARKVDFEREFDVDPLAPPSASLEEREADVSELVERLNDIYQPMVVPRRELAIQVDNHLTDFIAAITGQRVETSQQVRDFMLAQILFPFALGAADPLTGDVAIFKSVGVFEPHVIAHEFCHRKGYLKEVDAQILAYMALSESGDPIMEQSALCERLDRQLWLLADRKVEEYNERMEATGLRSELQDALRVRHPAEQSYAQWLGPMMKGLYDARMRMTGQNGLADYDEGFTNFLLAVERAA
jgi:hypothetical protein